MPEVGAVRKKGMGRNRSLILKGDRFNNLVFIEHNLIGDKLSDYGKFKCDCGIVSDYKINSVRYGGRKRCRECLNRINSKKRRKYPINNIFKSGFNSHNTSYILGLFFADGNVRSTGNTINLSLNEKDVKILEDIRDLIQPDKPLYYCNVKNGDNQYKLCISDIDIRQSFVNAGCVPNKSLKLTYPKIEIIHKDFIRGYIDGDGHISRKSLSIMGTKEFLDELLLIFISTFNKDIKVRWYQKNKNSNNWQLSISNIRDRKMILDWIYEDCNLRLERKFSTYLQSYCN